MIESWTTPRLLIRRFREDDWPELHEMQGDPETTKQLGGAWTLEKTRDVIKQIVAAYETKEFEWLAVADRQTDKVLGACWLAPLNAKWCKALQVGPQIELGYRYARRHWGNGYATEAARAMLRRGFDELGLSRITAIVDIRNDASERVIQKLGMKYQHNAERDGVTIRYYVLEKDDYRSEAAIHWQPPGPHHMNNGIQELIDLARSLLNPMRLGRADMSAATVAAALRSRSGRIYTGVCIHLSCGIGFCAEHAAVAEMIKGRETEIESIVAVCEDGVLAPCGRCRELMVQVNPSNFNAKVALPGNRELLLRELLPDHWMNSEEG